MREHRDLIDAAMVVNLDGGGGEIANGEHRYFGLGTSETVALALLFGAAAV